MHVLVHGGAGSTPDDPPGRQVALDRAAAVGRDASDPLDAVCAAVQELESAPQFNAGVGAVVQSDGRIRTDAGVMTGVGQCGAACAMPGVEHAVDVARAVATETPHVLLAGEGAISLADAEGVATNCDLWTADTRERWESVDPPAVANAGELLAWVREHFGGTDTVGAVALGRGDRRGGDIDGWALVCTRRTGG